MSMQLIYPKMVVSVYVGLSFRALHPLLRVFYTQAPDVGFFQYLRIEARGNEIYYVAHPRAKSPGTDFKLMRLTGQEAVFENPTHDFPKRIIYRRNGDGTLTALIEGDGTEKEKPEEFSYHPMPKVN